MKREFTRISLALGLVCVSCGGLISGDKEEHQKIANDALLSVLRECTDDSVQNLVKAFFPDHSFGGISDSLSGEDVSIARCHAPRRSILQQLESLPASLLAELLTWHTSNSSVRLAEQRNKNVVANYLLHHLIALNYADRAGEQKDQEALRRALVYEAMAISYLIDAFSSGHMLLPLGKPFASLQKRNFREAHNFYGRKGLYVINGRKEAWQTFGDQVMLWYGPTYRHVFEAGVTALRELFLVYYLATPLDDLPTRLESWARSWAGESEIPDMVEEWLKPKDGPAYYADDKMPSLLHLPMPISAAWSVRTNVEIDTSGLHRRSHYPQLSDSGYFDPDLPEFNKALLLSEAAVPGWLIPDLLGDNPNPDTARHRIRYHPDIASVRYTQETNQPPSFRGVLFHLASGFLLGNDPERGAMFGVGYGLFDDLFLINNVSLDFLFLRLADGAQGRVLTAAVGAGLKRPESLPIKGITAFRLEAGPAAQWNFGKLGYRIATGLELPIIPLGFTYAGVTSRLMFQRIEVGAASHGVYLQFVVH